MSARILIIEDDPASGELVRYLLEKSGHVTLLAEDGARGVAVALAEAPDLVVCDLQLPRLDGHQVAAALRQSAEWRRVPLIAVTALSMRGDRERTLAAGFDGYITKPITPETFVSEVLAFLPPGPRRSA